MISHRKRKPITTRTGVIPAQLDPRSGYSYQSEPEYSSTEVSLIEEGDYVRHKLMDYLNNGLPFRVIEITRNEVLCSYMDGLTNTPILTWYEKTNLELVSSAADQIIE